MGSQISTASGQTWTLTSYLNDLPDYNYEKRHVVLLGIPRFYPPPTPWHRYRFRRLFAHLLTISRERDRYIRIASSTIPDDQMMLSSAYHAMARPHISRSLESTRFVKVIKARHEQGSVVIKIFIKQDTSLPYRKYIQQIERMSSRNEQ